MHPQTLRYYERVGLIEPSRTRGKIRLYSQRDIERLQLIQRLVNDLGVNLAGVEVIMNLTERLAQTERQAGRVGAPLRGGESAVAKSARTLS